MENLTTMEEKTRRVTNTTDINVVKRDGTTELFDIDKIHKMVEIACENITGVFISDVEMEAGLSFYDSIATNDIHGSLIKAAANLISEKSPNYQYVAGRLLNFDIRKQAWGSIEPPRLFDHVTKLVNDGYYSPELLELYSEEDWDKMDAIIDHDRDLKMAYIGVKEYLTKYSVRDRSLDTIIPQETPQITYMLIAALMRSDTCNIKDVKSYYNDVSLGNISLPTPIMAGMRTTTKQFSSCVLIECDDTLDSIERTNVAVQEYISKKAGIGVGASSIRAVNSSVANKTINHTGVIPYFKQIQGTVKSCSQGGVRGGAATVNVLLWHLEIENILVLKNNKGSQDNRVRQLDYCVAINNYLYKRIMNDDNITLFSPHDVPDLYQAFYNDSDTFGELYEKYEKDATIRKASINGLELFSKFATERKDTGRIYAFNVDNVQSHSSFVDPVRMTNLCVEITLITNPMGSTETYDIYVPKENLLHYVNELANSDIVRNFTILGV